MKLPAFFRLIVFQLDDQRIRFITRGHPGVAPQQLQAQQPVLRPGIRSAQFQPVPHLFHPRRHLVLPGRGHGSLLAVVGGDVPFQGFRDDIMALWEIFLNGPFLISFMKIAREMGRMVPKMMPQKFRISVLEITFQA